MFPGLVDQVSAVIRDVARAEILPRFRQLGQGDVREKGPGDLVTVADEESERQLTPRLAGLLPGSVVIGEEAVAADPAVLDRLFGTDPVWIIDPVDGTLNFSQGSETFGVIVALVIAGETVAGWIYDPCADRMATTVKGQGAWLDGRRLRVAAPAAPAAMTGALSVRFFEADVRRRLQERAQGLGKPFALGCAAHEYLRLTSGAAHFSLYQKLMPWDHAAGVLLHAEAGGFGARFDGSPYRPTHLAGGLLLAPDEESWRALRDLLIVDGM